MTGVPETGQITQPGGYFLGNEPVDLIWRTGERFPLGEEPRKHRAGSCMQSGAVGRRPFGLQHLTPVTPARVVSLSDVTFCHQQQVSMIEGGFVVAATKEVYTTTERTRYDNQYIDDFKEDTQSD